MDDEPTLDELIREAYAASEGFDNWDRGKTYYPNSQIFNDGPRLCSLEEVVAEQEAANKRLIDFVKENY